MIVSESKSSPLLINLFGPMQVLIEGQPLPHLRSRKALWLLALLALRSGRAIERNWLAGTLWPDIDESKAAANLRVNLSELRRALGSQGVRLQSPGRYTLMLDLAGATSDVCEFDKAIAEQNIPALQRAVTLYRGPLLEGCTEEWSAQERTARERGCLLALQTLAENALVSAGYAAAAGYFRRTIDLEPLSEEAQRGLMQALSQGGDANAALDTYQAFLRALRTNDPKATPDEKTNALYGRLRSEARKRAASPTAFAAAEPPTPIVTGYLPHPLTDLVGREDERAEVASALRRKRLVTLTGPGGIGKTRLAIQVATEAAAEFPDGAWLVGLETLSEETALVGQIAGVVGAKEVPGRTFLQVLTDYLRSKRLLLVLDNCEHLLDESARVAGDLLRDCAGVRVLATSREALGITGETAWTVPGLATPDPAHLPVGRASTLVKVLSGYESVELFVERAQAVQKGFVLARANALQIARVCARLEGIPLAIELAAARIRALTIDQIEAKLDDHLSLLKGGSRTAMARHQTLRATLDWSYDLLGERERLVLERMSIFTGGCNLESAEQICMGNGVEACDVVDLLTSLVDKSLVVFTSAPEATGRYVLLETVRQYAAERLKAREETADTRAKHLTHFLEVALALQPNLQGNDPAPLLRRLEMEHDNLRAALRPSDCDPNTADEQLRLAVALFPFWLAHGHYLEGRQILEKTLAQAGAGANSAARAAALRSAGSMALYSHDFEAPQALYEESMAIYRELGDKIEEGRLFTRMAAMRIDRGDYINALEPLEKSLLILREEGDKTGIAEALANLAATRFNLGDYALAVISGEESLQLFEELGDKRRIAQVLHTLANCVYEQSGNYPDAKPIYERSLNIFDEIGDHNRKAMVMLSLGTAASCSGDSAVAWQYLEQSAAIFRETGNRTYLGWTLATLGSHCSDEGEQTLAKKMVEESLNLFETLENQAGMLAAYTYLGQIADSMGDTNAACSYYANSLALCRDLQMVSAVTNNLTGLASALLARQQTELAAKLLAAAFALDQNLGAVMPPPEQVAFDALVTQARAALDDNVFDATWAEGSALNWEDAIAFALAHT